MIEPLFWLGLSILLVAVSLTAVLVALLPAVRELSRAARSAEKLFDTLNRELPPTLESIRLTGLEITGLTDEVSQGVQSASRVVQQVDQGFVGVKHQAKKAQRVTRGFVVGCQAAWKSLTQSPRRRPVERLPAGGSELSEWEADYERNLTDGTLDQELEPWQYRSSGDERYDEAYIEVEEVETDEIETATNSSETVIFPDSSPSSSSGANPPRSGRPKHS